MRTRSWSIRVKIVAMVAVPLVALLALWVFATAITAGPALSLLSARTLLDTVGNPGEVLMGEVQRERKISVQFLADPKASPGPLDAQRAATDRAADEFRRKAGSAEARRAASATLESRIQQVYTDLDGLTTARDYIDRREVDVVGAQNLYNSIVDSGFQMFAATASFNDERVDREIRALTTVGRGQEHLSRIDSLLTGAHAAGKFTEQSRAELVQAIGTSRFLFAQGITDLPERDRVAWQRLSRGAAFNRLQELQDQLMSTSRADAPSPVGSDTWQPAFDSTAQQLRAFEINATDSLAEDVRPVATGILLRLGLAGVLGLVAVIATVLVSLRVGRSIVGRLVRLRREALQVAEDRLPAVVKRLQRGEAVDVEQETPPLEYGRDEIGEVARAFNEVQRTAVQSAIEEANVRRGINEVFLNIARRSQTLLHRQLALLDKMERRETGPDELEDLYRVDHLATRMRRHAEDLVILAGAAPGRGWRNPVPMIDVVRGAISEVEDYKRVHIVAIAPSAVLGRAVGDVIHLLAELLENAAAFSPPQTQVEVVGQALPNGYAVEIEDRGLGMSAEAIAEANRKLVEPPEFDPANSARLGLFVVAQLAARQGLRVSLRPSSYGGVTAIVLIPDDLVTTVPPGSLALPAPTPGSLPALAPGSQPGLAALPAGPKAGNGIAAQAALGHDIAGYGSTEHAGAGPAVADQAIAGQSFAGRRAADQPTAEHFTADHVAPEAVIADEAWAPPMHGNPVAQPVVERPTPEKTGPAPSAAISGLTPDGLVRRRRTGPRRRPHGPVEPPAHLPPNQTSPAALSPPPFRIPAQRAPSDPIPPAPIPPVHGQSTPMPPDTVAPTSVPPEVVPPASVPPDAVPPASVLPEVVPPADIPLEPVPPARMPSEEGMPAPVLPTSALPDTGAPAPTVEEGLPRRVRQANLVPQLREPAAERAEPTTVRSPEEVRSLMSALQRGTKRGRQEAAALLHDTSESAASEGADASGEQDLSTSDKERTAGQPAWSEAATVTFPAVPGDVDGSGDREDSAADGKHQNHRLDKDA